VGAERLNGPASLYLHRDVDVTAEEIVDEYAARHSISKNAIGFQLIIELEVFSVCLLNLAWE